MNRFTTWGEKRRQCGILHGKGEKVKGQEKVSPRQQFRRVERAKREAMEMHARGGSTRTGLKSKKKKKKRSPTKKKKPEKKKNKKTARGARSTEREFASFCHLQRYEDTRICGEGQGGGFFYRRGQGGGIKSGGHVDDDGSSNWAGASTALAKRFYKWAEKIVHFSVTTMKSKRYEGHKPSTVPLLTRFVHGRLRQKGN